MTTRKRHGLSVGISGVSGLARPIDPSFRSNRLAIIGTFAAGLLISASSWIGSSAFDPMAVIGGSLAVFLAWAIARELDPDNPVSAAVAMFAALAFAFSTGVEAAGAAVSLLGLRVIVGSVGRPLRPADYLVLILAAGYGGSQPELWPSAAVIVLALAISRPLRARIAAASSITAWAISALLWSPGLAWDTSAAALAGVAFGVLAALASLPSSSVSSSTDAGSSTISSTRVALARMVAGGTVAATSLISATSFPTVAPTLAALASVALTGTFSASSTGTSAAGVDSQSLDGLTVPGPIHTA